MATVSVPDIGNFKDVPVIEIHVKAGDNVSANDPLVTLESDKAAMEVPSPLAGVVAQVLVKLGDTVNTGTPLIRLNGAGDLDAPPATATYATEPAPEVFQGAPESRSPATGALATAGPADHFPTPADFGAAHASPAVRRLARELDIDLTKINGTGEKGRITKEDIKRLMRGEARGLPSGEMGIPAIPPQDFSKFGPIETKPLSRLKRLSGPHLHRAWLNIPHITHTDEADITELESYREPLDAAAKKGGYRVTLLAFLMKASVVALKEYPEFNASLSPDKDALILKRYYHLGIAVDTPEGLVVPVIKDVDRKGILELSQELSAVSQKMREGNISPSDIQGATFSISSLGGIGGTNFTPIVNAPELAILGIVRAATKPVWDGKAFQPRLMLPLCLSYDHRVIDGALAARFTRRLADILADIRALVL
jgi:pyruvate dehydrogenase E2 component (dihydrolipoamide acetyltransferase)